MPRLVLPALAAAGLAALSNLPLSAADLSAALRRAQPAPGAAPALPADAPLAAGPVVVPLRRVSSPLPAAHGAAFYVGNISIGHPAQELTVLFDTASAHVLVPHRACRSRACLERRRYSPWASGTAMDVNSAGTAVQAGKRFATGNGTRDGLTVSFTQSDLGEGDVQAVFVRDAVCVGNAAPAPRACVDMTVLAATSMQDRPFRGMPCDGIVGLGLDALAGCPRCGFFGRLLEGARPGAVLPQFGISLAPDAGALHLGGHDGARLGAPLRWFPVDHPEDGYWQVAIQAVRVGGRVVDDCRRGCHGIVDTAVSRLGVQASKLPTLRAALAAFSDGAGVCRGPDLSLDLGSFSLTLRAADYTRSGCRPDLGELNLEEPAFTGVYALGATVLRRYYAAFDWEARRLGFAPLADDAAPGLGSGTATRGRAPPPAAAAAAALVVV